MQNKVWPEPDRVLSPDTWTELAKILSRDRLPLKEKREICDAIFEYDHARLANERATDEKSEKATRRRVDPTAKGRAALSNFIKYVRGLRQAFYSIEQYLKREDLILEAQQLTEQIHKFQKLAQQELDKKTRGGRPWQKIRNDLVIRLGIICKRLIRKKITRGGRDKKGQVRGQFPLFVYTIFRALGICTTGLPNAIAKAVQYVNNPP
jgi:hypothetical protein